MLVLTSAEMRQAEADAVAHGTSYAELMENAGLAAAESIKGIAYETGCGKSILLLAGRGNNAGDAFVVARLLAEDGWLPSVLLLCGREFSPLARENYEAMPGETTVYDEVGEAEQAGAFNACVICDGVFGAGFHGELPPDVARACRAANEAEAVRIALDLPSGLDPDTGHVAADAFCAAHTLAFGAYKPGLVVEENAPVYGQVHLLDIGL